MGNAESSTDEENIPKDQNQNAETSNEVDKFKEALNKKRDFSNPDNLTYNNIFLENDEDEDDPLNEYTDDDEDNSASSIDGSYALSTASAMAKYCPFKASINFILTYVSTTASLKIDLQGSNDIPLRKHGASNVYQLTMEMRPLVAELFESKLRNGPNPRFDDIWEIKVVRKQLHQSALYFQLYDCRNGERENMIAEGSFPCQNLNFRVPTPHHLHLSPRLVSRTRMLEEAEKHNTLRSDRDTMLRSTRQTNIRDPSYMFTQMPDPQRTTLARGSELPAVRTLRPLPSELLLNASYKPTTGEFVCIIQKIYGLSVPGKSSDLPSAFVRLQLETSEHKLMAKSKTKVVKKRKHPTFDETFVFSVTEDEIQNVTLTLHVFHKHPPTKKVDLGHFSMGAKCSSNIETEHWTAIMHAKGDPVIRWHKLYPS